jgi:hypothetical protein
MIRDLLAKASHSAKAARALLEGDAPDDGVSRALASAFCALAAKRGEVIHAGLADELVLRAA